jgi:molecular chaperone DnaJ
MNRDWVDKDFYAILGVSRDASQEEIKRAYRKLAQQLHPDRNPDDPKAEERFKEVSEAYSVLSNPERRKEYDELRRMVESGGFVGFGGPGGGPFGGQRVRVEDLSDLFGSDLLGGLGDLFGFGARRSSGPRRGADLTGEVHLSFEDAVRGVTTTVKVTGEAPCSRCGGSGAEPGTAPRTCPTCMGRGQIAQNQGFFSFTQPCPQCRGTGKLIDSPCRSCRGRGTEMRTRDVRVKIPAGVKDGARIRIPGKGAPGRAGGPPGDLYVTVRVAKHPIFTRRGNDLLVTVPISYTEAALGTKVEVPTLDGKVTLKIPPGTPSGKTFRVRGKGVPSDRGRPGDLLVRVEVAVPKRLSKEEKKLLEQLAAYETEDLRAHLKV